MNIYVPGSGNASARIAIVGEAPMPEEEAALRPFVGASGRELDRLLKDSGINRGELWITNVCKYMVPSNMKGKHIPFATRAKSVGINIAQQIDELRTELYQINPNVILALGGTALWALTGKTKISDYRGSILCGMGKKVVGTYHPAHLLHQQGEVTGYWQRQVMIFDFKRALAQSLSPKIELPSRTLNVCQNSAQLYDFIQRYKGYTRPSIDIEAHPNGSGIPICVGTAFTPHEGITIPLWNSEEISNIPDSDLVQCWLLLANLLGTNNIVGANFKYDQDKILRLGFIIKRLISDTMLKAFAINPELPKNLAFNTSIYTEEPFYKNEGMYEGSVRDLLLGCARDACVTKEVDLKQDIDLDQVGMRPYYENFIMPLHELYLAIENTGFRVSEVRREELLRKYIKWDEKLSYELWKVCGDEVNPGSPKQVSILLYEILKCPHREGTGEEVLTSLFNQVKNDRQKSAITNILDARRVRKTINQYLMSLPDFDGRMKTTYFVCLETGRTATGMLEPPIRPRIDVIDKGKKKKKDIGMAFQTITKHGDIGNDVRSMFIPDEGEVFIQADSSQAEARVIFVLANEPLSFFDEHDGHALTASWFVGGIENDWSKKILGYEHPNRFLGKTLRHSGHLGAKARRAAIEVNTQARKYKIPIVITEREAEKALEIFHRNFPNLRSVYHAGIVQQLEKNRTLHAAIPYGIDSPIGPRRQFFERWGDELFRQAFSYIPQRSVSDNTKNAALRIKKLMPDIKIIVEAHDSLLFSIKTDEVRDRIPIIRTEMQRPIDFGPCTLSRGLLSIPCDIEIGDNYQELHKYKP